jgi:hypothetical protein
MPAAPVAPKPAVSTSIARDSSRPARSDRAELDADFAALNWPAIGGLRLDTIAAGLDSLPVRSLASTLRPAPTYWQSARSLRQHPRSDYADPIVRRSISEEALNWKENR